MITGAVPLAVQNLIEIRSQRPTV